MSSAPPQADPVPPSIELSVVIPMRDEALNVAPLHAELSRVLGEVGLAYEVIFIDDGSADGTIDRLKEVQSSDPHVRVIRFTRNFGQTAAFAAGFEAVAACVRVALDRDRLGALGQHS
ncbi:MAG: glycosyltransferase, partial [Rhizobacter sp.]